MKTALGYYRLAADGETPIKCEDLIQWAKYFATSNRQVAENYIGEVRVSTVFLGLDHAWWGGPPMLLETMVFGGQHDGHQERASSRAEALTQHAEALDLVASDIHKQQGKL